MLTLKELKKVVKVADMEADIPSAKVLDDILGDHKKS